MKTKENYNWEKAMAHCFRVPLSKSALAEIQGTIPFGILGELTYPQMGGVMQDAILADERRGDGRW